MLEAMLDRQRENPHHEAAPTDPSAVPPDPAWPSKPEGGNGSGRTPDGDGRASGGAGDAGSTDVGDLDHVRAVIDALPEAVFITESDGELRLTNPAADRLFAGEPVQDRADLLSRFEEIGPDRRRRRPAAPSIDDPQPNVTVRPRHQPNRWFALRTVALDAEPEAPSVEVRPPVVGGTPATGEPAGAVDRPAGDFGIPSSSDEPSGKTAFLLRDVTDSRDLQPLREAFLDVLSHELRTPITTIYAGSSVLARRPTLSPRATQALARDISAEASRLYDLVEDLLVLARLERRVLAPLDEPVLVQRSVDATIRTISDRTIDATIERRGDVDVPPVRGDGTYVEQACRNLILTAARYAGPEPDRRLVVEVRSRPEEGEVTIAVLDRGPDLAPDEPERAFELPDASAIGRLAGSGVGPFVCRHLVEAMGGRVWARNRPGGGLEMGFALRIDERA
jgi:signal transduction histidine kinase